MQQTNFAYELVVSDDCSTDRTREIVLEFQRKFPDRIRVVFPSKNLGFGGNGIFVKLLEELRGSYVAVLDGDDYWTSSTKLQAQADFLDEYPECAMCFHNVSILYQDSSEEPELFNPPTQSRISTLAEILERQFIAYCSVMYRGGAIAEFPAWFYETTATDWVLHILNAQHGSIGYLDDIMGVYRVHRGGVFSSLSKIRKLESHLADYRRLDPGLYRLHLDAKKRGVSRIYYELAREYQQSGNWPRAVTHGLRCIRERPEMLLQVTRGFVGSVRK
jgi:glycosyltransferase involved in cell wall biosynthesis